MWLLHTITLYVAVQHDTLTLRTLHIVNYIARNTIELRVCYIIIVNYPYSVLYPMFVSVCVERGEEGLISMPRVNRGRLYGIT